jgi:hypothetical protein
VPPGPYRPGVVHTQIMSALRSPPRFHLKAFALAIARGNATPIAPAPSDSPAGADARIRAVRLEPTLPLLPKAAASIGRAIARAPMSRGLAADRGAQGARSDGLLRVQPVAGL